METGSSPLTRGKLAAGGRQLSMMGLIPAHAGKTARPRPWEGARPAHPRSRGENEAAIQAGADTAGSSPLTRGKPRDTHTTSHKGGLIPAHAGKTGEVASTLGGLGAHPRSRGENSDRLLMMYTRAGSSPLTRGKLREGVG